VAVGGFAPTSFEDQEPENCKPKDICLDTDCGTVDDGCNGTLECPPCCEPKTACLDTDCGTVDDGCDGTLECAPCCTPLDCTTVGTCGSGLDDGCNGLIDCPCPEEQSTEAPVTCIDDKGKCDPAVDVCCNPDLTCKGTGRRGVFKCQ
jgi:hypothetical protein